MKKFYSLFLLMLFAIVGAGQAWAEDYTSGQEVDALDLDDGDTVAKGVVITDNTGHATVIIYNSKSEMDADTDGFGGTYIWDFPYTVDAENGFTVYFNTNYDVCLVSASSDDNKIADVDFKLADNSYYYATFYSEEAWEVPAADKMENTKVYVIENVDGKDIVPTKIAESGDVVAGGTAVLLQSATARTVTINKSSETPNVSYSGTNHLVGSDTEQTFNDDDKVYYILSNSNDVAGFYWQNGSDKGDKVVNGAYKASLWVSKSVAPSNVLNIRFDDTVTSISNIEKQSVSDTYYNMQGQRAKANSNGILIRNGQKFFVR